MRTGLSYIPFVCTEDFFICRRIKALFADANRVNEEGYTGEGMVIAIVDSEFDVNHEFLSCDVKNPKYTKESMAEAIANNKLNAGASANRVWHSEKIPFAYNYTDNNSDTYTSDPQLIHGTHVAGIAAGKGGTMMDGTLFDGNAPEAQLLCMAVPSLEDAANIAAIDDAIKLGADVLNASWGTDYLEAGLYDEIFSNAALAGMYICCSAGNSTMGYNETPPAPKYYDYGSVGSPCDNDCVTTVASADNTKEWLDTLHIYVDGQEAAPVEEQNYGVPFESTVDSENGMEYVMCGSDYTGSQNMTGKIAVFDLKDEDSTAAIFAAARNGGASAVIVLVPEDLFNDWFYLDSEIVGDMPSVTVPDTQRQLFSNGQRITADKFKTLRLSKEYIGMSYYSSWGVFDTLNLDPNITAIGGNVYSSVPDNKYDVFSGTSMASPQLAGSVAVIKEYLLKNEASFSDLTPTERNIEIENRMMSTAKDMYVRNDEGEMLPCSPRHMGAGFLDAVAAVTTPVVLKGESGRTKIELRDKLTDDISFTFSANSLTDKAVTYDTVSMIAFTNETDMG